MRAGHGHDRLLAPHGRSGPVLTAWLSCSAWAMPGRWSTGSQLRPSSASDYRPTTGPSWSASGPARSTRSCTSTPHSPPQPTRPDRRACRVGPGPAPPPPGVPRIRTVPAVPATWRAAAVGQDHHPREPLLAHRCPDPDAWPVVLFNDPDWVDCGRGFFDILLDHLTGRNPLHGLIGFNPGWPPRWQPMRHREIPSPKTGP
jgi:hypothetical protein